MIDFIFVLVKQIIVRFFLMLDDVGCMEIIVECFELFGFFIEYINCNGVINFWVWCGIVKFLFVLVGYIDVVLIGLLE